MLTLAEMERVVQDIGQDAPPDGYSDEMLRWRTRTEAEFEEWQAAHPDAVIYLPADINGLPGDEPAPPGPAAE